MPDEDAHRDLFVGIDRASRWVYMEILGEKTAVNAASFLQRLVAKAPFQVQKVLTDNGKEFTDRSAPPANVTPPGVIALIALARATTSTTASSSPVIPRQRPGRALQWPDQRGAGHHPLRFSPAPGGHPEPLGAPV